MLVERDEELQRLRGVLVDLDSAGGKVVLVRGEAGIGKSSLVDEFESEFADKAHFLIGSCDDLLTPQALGPFWDIARNEPSVAEPLRARDRPALLDAVLDLLSRSLRPTVLVVEDTHWADEATLDAIKYLGRRVGRTNSVVLLTYRDGMVDYDHPLRGVMGELPPERVVRLQLSGLSPSGVTEIIGESDLDVDQVMLATGGNPFLVTEVARAGGDGVPSSVQDSVGARVRKLSEHAREVLKVFSVIPERIPLMEVDLLIGDAVEGLEECEQRGLVSVDADFVGFRHELIRRAVEKGLTGSERMAINRRVLNALPADTDPARLIHHAREANASDSIVELAPRAAHAAAHVGSHREAVDHWRQLLPRLGDFDAAARAPLVEAWAHEEFLVDNVAESVELCEMAIRDYLDTGHLSAASNAIAQASHYYENAGLRRRADELAEQAVEMLGPHPDAGDLARALEAQAYLQMMAGNNERTSELVDRALEVGGDALSERILIRCLSHKGVMMEIGEYPAGSAALDEAARRAAAAGQWYEEARAFLNHSWAASEARDLRVAVDYAKRAIASASRHELSGLEAYSIALQARALELLGEWTTAEDLAREQLTASPITQMVARPLVGVIEARSGREAGSATLDQAWEMAITSDEFQRLAPAAAALAEYSWIRGRSDPPIEDFRAVLTRGLGIGFVWITGALAFWLWKLGELGEPPEGIAAPYRLVMEGDAVAAAQIWADLGCPYERALAMMHGDHAAQIEALETFETLGASAVAAKVRKSLRDQGVVVPRGKGKQTRRNRAGLTARQAEALSLVAEGLSNAEIADRLFLSPRTVEHHVAAVISKLDVASRDQAVVAAREQGLLGPA